MPFKKKHKLKTKTYFNELCTNVKTKCNEFLFSTVHKQLGLLDLNRLDRINHLCKHSEGHRPINTSISSLWVNKTQLVKTRNSTTLGSCGSVPQMIVAYMS